MAYYEVKDALAALDKRDLLKYLTEEVLLSEIVEAFVDASTGEVEDWVGTHINKYYVLPYIKEEDVISYVLEKCTEEVLQELDLRDLQEELARRGE